MSSVAAAFAHRRVRLGNVEPAAVALLRQFDPALVIISLLACEYLYATRLTPALGAYTTLAFIASGQLFTQMGVPEAAHHLATFPRTYGRILLQWASVIAILLFVAFMFKASTELSRKVALTWFSVTPVVLGISHALRVRLNWSAANGARAPRHVIIGVNEVGCELARRLTSKGFLGYFDFRSVDRLADIVEPSRLAGHCRDVADYVRANAVSMVYIALPLSNVPRMSNLVNALRDTTASVYFVPDAFAFDLIQSRLVEINGMPALSVCDTPFQGIDAALKRTMDLLLATAALILLSPVMLVVCAAVKLSSGGPILFRQRRYGLNGEEILVYKFRSMTTLEDGPVVTQATEFDARVTRVGRILRRTSLDELPQLFNVLLGSMSIVGPRPHAVAHNEMYRKLISGYMIRHKVRPGITGLAQVSGMRGETATLDRMSERVRFDLEYLRRWSPLLDLQIICRTIGHLIGGSKNAY